MKNHSTAGIALNLNPLNLFALDKMIPSAVKTIIFISISGLFVFSIFQMGFFTRDSYAVKDYEKKISQLSKANEALEIEFSKSNSLSNIENYLSNQNFVKASKIKYIEASEGPMAANK